MQELRQSSEPRDPNVKMKILIVSDAWKPQLNGVVRTYEYLCEELLKQGHQVKVIGPVDFPRRFALPGYKEIELAILPYKRLREMIDNFAPDSIHIATEASLGIAARKYCLKHKVPFTTSYHTHFPDYIAKRVARFLPFLKHTVRDMAIAHLRRFHAPSGCLMLATESLQKELKEWGFNAPVLRLTRGVNIDLFKPGPSKHDKQFKKPCALYVGRVAIEKNLEDFLQMPWEGDKIIVGDGPSMDELQQKYPNSHFAGKQEGKDLADYYRAGDLFVFPSRTDTFGIVLIEALACGIPVAGYRVTGPQDIITEDFLGALHDSDLKTAADNALKQAGSKDDLHQYVCEHYTWEKATEQFLDGVWLARINL